MKKLTLILSMMFALVGFNANAAMYLVGNEPLGQGWNPNVGIEMTDNGDGTYTYDVVINGDAWFCFAEALTAGNTNDDWNNFNTNYRYGPNTGRDQEVTAAQWMTTQKQGNGSGSYKFHGSGDKYTVTFDKNNLKFMIDGYVEPIVYESFTVAGNNADIFGEEWNPAFEANDMTLDETDGLYKLVKENVEIANAPYTLYYKVAANHAWGESWGNPEGPDGNQDYVFNENGTYNLTFKFNFDTKEVTLDAEQTEVGPVVETYYIVAGTQNLFGSNWAATDTLNLMTEIDGGMFTWTKEGFEATAGTEVEFKVVANGNWNTCWPPSDEEGDHNWYYKFEEDGVYAVTITFNEETKEINMEAVRTGDLPEPTVDPVYIIGDVDNIGWNATQGVEMTYNEGIYSAEITTQNQGDLGIAYFGLTKKLAETNDSIGWASIEPYRFGPVSNGAFLMTEELLNQSIELDLEGSYESVAIPEGTWTVTVDLANGILKINGTWPADTVTPEPETTVYIMGEVNDNGGWFTNKGVDMTYNDGIYSAEITTAGENDGKSFFSFTTKLAEGEADWEAIAPYRFGPVSEGDFIMTEELLGVECALTTDGSNAIAVPAGEWTVTVDLENMIFTINGEWPTTEPYDGDVYIMGEVNDNGGWFTNKGVKMTRDAENNVYTATITTAGENINEGEEIGYSYFSFTKQLAEGEADWDAIAPYRFGAVSEGDFLVTEELLGQELALENAGDAYKIVAGTWNLTLSVDNMTLVIEKYDGIRGDVNNDQIVSIGDVTDLIDYLLSGNGEGLNLQNADCNLDEGVTISDVTALIDFLLSGGW